LTDGLSDGVGLSEDFVPSTGTEEEFVYEISEDGKYIYFGKYPQTLMSADMDPETDLEQISDHYYRGTDGEIYYEYTINLSLVHFLLLGLDEATWINLDQLDASTGEEMANGGTYYFKMEPIKWRILDEVDGTYTIVADTNLQATAYQPNYTENGNDWYAIADGAPEGTYANNYKYSELRRFLNDDFMDMAFTSTQEAMIRQVEIDNLDYSTGEEASYTTTDKVYALSVEETNAVLAEIGEEAAMAWMADLETSDFSRATGTMTFTKAVFTTMMGASEEEAVAYEAYFNTGSTWLRSPVYYDYTSSSKQVYVVRFGGSVMDISQLCVGILPALQLKIN